MNDRDDDGEEQYAFDRRGDEEAGSGLRLCDGHDGIVPDAPTPRQYARVGRWIAQERGSRFSAAIVRFRANARQRRFMMVPRSTPIQEAGGKGSGMSRSATFYVQPFAGENGCLAPLRRIAVASAEEAKAMVGAMVPTVPAAAALCLTVDEDGHVCMTTILARAGDVPEEWLATLLDVV